MAKTTTQEIRNLCYVAYQAGGQYAVYDLVQDMSWVTEWCKCEPCEDCTPHIDRECLVCGSEWEGS